MALTVSSIAMLTACATSRDNAPPAAVDPVIETRVETRVVCPAEVTAATPTQPEPGPGALLSGNDAGMAFLSILFAHAQLLRGRIDDARAECARAREAVGG